jgi:multiple antibiotic resistance protein
VFLAVTFGAATAHKVAVRAVLIAFAVLLTFVVFGQLVLDALGLGLPSFQIAGGLVLLLFALSMIFGTSKPETEVAEWDHHASAVYPLAMPSIASPGAMLAVVVLTDNDRFSIAHQAMTAGLMAVVLAITLVILLLAAPIHRVIGATGASIVSRVMGMILAAVAVDAILKGFVVLGVIAAF